MSRFFLNETAQSQVLKSVLQYLQAALHAMDLGTLQLALGTIENLHNPGLSKEGAPL